MMDNINNAGDCYVVLKIIEVHHRDGRGYNVSRSGVGGFIRPNCAFADTCSVELRTNKDLAGKSDHKTLRRAPAPAIMIVNAFGDCIVGQRTGREGDVSWQNGIRVSHVEMISHPEKRYRCWQQVGARDVPDGMMDNINNAGDCYAVLKIIEVHHRDGRGYNVSDVRSRRPIRPDDSLKNSCPMGLGI